MLSKQGRVPKLFLLFYKGKWWKSDLVLFDILWEHLIFNKFIASFCTYTEMLTWATQTSTPDCIYFLFFDFSPVMSICLPYLVTHLPCFLKNMVVAVCAVQYLSWDLENTTLTDFFHYVFQLCCVYCFGKSDFIVSSTNFGRKIRFDFTTVNVQMFYAALHVDQEGEEPFPRTQRCARLGFKPVVFSFSALASVITEIWKLTRQVRIILSDFTCWELICPWKMDFAEVPRTTLVLMADGQNFF